MGNLCIKKQPEYSITLLLLGFNNAGKTQVFSRFCKEKRPKGPTMGIHVYEPKVSVPRSKKMHDVYDLGISIIELGGSKDVRGIWEYYYPEAMGVIYMIDATDHDRIEDNKIMLHKLMTHNYLRKKPFLLLSNRRTLRTRGYIDVIDISNSFNIEKLSNSNMTPCRLEEVDFESINDPLLFGVRWITERVIREYNTIVHMCDLQIRIRDLTEEFKKFTSVKKTKRRHNKKNGKRNNKKRPNYFYNSSTY